MNFREFIASRQESDDLRKFDDCPYGKNNGDYAEPVKGYAYAGGEYAIEALPNGTFRVFIQFEQDFRDLLSAELELFYYYGREVGQTYHLNFFERLEMACRSSDLDAACRYIQDGLGQQYGDTASLFFSWHDESDGPNETNWARVSLRQRFEWMRDYIRQELDEVDARLTDPDSDEAAFIPPEDEGSLDAMWQEAGERETQQ